MSNVISLKKCDTSVQEVIKHLGDTTESIQSIFVVVFRDDKKIEYSAIGTFSEACTAGAIMTNHALECDHE